MQEEKNSEYTPKDIRDKVKTYLVGSMEDSAARDEGKGWRNYLRPKLEERDIHVFDPSIGEEERTGMPSKELQGHLHNLIACGKYEEFESYMDKIWKGTTYTNEKNEITHIMGDKDYVEHSWFLTVHIDEGDRPCGTYGEMYQAWLFNKPIYLITRIPKNKLSKSMLYWIINSKGEVFNSFTQYLEFIDKKYREQIRKVKREKE